MLILSSDFLNTPVFNENNQKLGRVSDYAFDVDTLKIEQITVRTTSALRSLSPELIISHKQIIKIDSDKVIVDSLNIKEPALKEILLSSLKPLSPSKPNVSAKQ